MGEQTEDKELTADNKMLYAFLMHEVKTSLLCVSGVLRGMLEAGDFPSGKIAMCEREMSRMVQSMSRVLDTSCMLTGKYKSSVEAVNLQEYAAFLEELYGTLTRERNEELHVKVEREAYHYLYLDRVMLTHICNNLVTNAVKYSEKNGCVEVRLGSVYVEEYRARLQISVQNHGIGMSERFLKEAFEPYTRERRIPAEGNGIGLYVVRKMVELMKGTIAVDAGKDGDVSIRIELAVDGADEFFHGADKAQEKKKPGNRFAADIFAGKKILVAEDDELFINWVAETLEKYGMSVDKTYDGNEVTDLFAGSGVGEYDAILMDLNMAGMSGTEAVHFIRGSGRADAETIPILAYTGMPIADEAAFLAAHRMQAVVPKVFDEEELVAAFAGLSGMTVDQRECT